MNSSVTLDSATSVMSSLCLEISPSSRSNGPSKTSRCTSKAPEPRGASAASPPVRSFAALSVMWCDAQPVIGDGWLARGQTDAPGQQAVLAAGVQVGQQHGDGLADEPAPVDDHAEPAQRQARVLKVEQFGGGQVDGDLVVVLFPAGRRAFTSRGWRGFDGAQELLHPGDTYPARPPPACRHRSSTSLASSR